MIISHRHRFIFIKTSKTAGTSTEIALSKHCGDDDIITPISPKDEILRLEMGGRPPQNYRTPGRFVFDDAQKDPANPKPPKRHEGFYNHISAAKIKELVDENIWENYTKICIERNPWDRAISLYFWRHKKEPRPALKSYILSEEILWLRERGFNLYTINNEVVVDQIIKYENLEEELGQFGDQQNISGQLTLAKAKAGYRKDKRHYRELMDPEMNDRIKTIFKDEIELLDYCF